MIPQSESIDELEVRVLSAQTDIDAADRLIRDYLPFIKSETSRFLGRAPIEGHDDELGIAMYAFHEAIMSYKSGRGGFTRWASLTIRSRLIDYRRRERRHLNRLSLDHPASDEEDSLTLGESLHSELDELEQRQNLLAARDEIGHFSESLAKIGLELSDIANSCPKQKRTLEACHRVLRYARENPELLARLETSGKLPIAELSVGSGIERKTLERHRRYIIALMLAYTNGFEIIREHIGRISPSSGGNGK